ncbi:GAF domain-containing sensor histidine kinase [Pelagibius litoralis]|uniref:histidine kinase n=1 Tax=Pelagibius litoralis TaxID=374515 RepID=A0A967EZ81_9PROT|nr:GAF domain-containing sensor histidine kinase [Pelagibius litoralis]NIA70131.1 GAF domain-containing sensor histidine kinase [Pelagibius litoralis]
MPPIPFDEVQRLASLRALDILDTPPEPAFDRITRLAAQQFDVPIALISLIDPARQWFKSKVGLEVDQTPREFSFCQFTIMDSKVMQVPDATQDPRFAENPFVTGEPGVRFYAGAPLVTEKGFRLGTLCLVDSQAKAPLDEAQQARLRDFAHMVINEMELRRLRKLLGGDSLGLSSEVAGALSSLREAEEELAHQAQMDVIAHVAHELRTPLGAMLGFAEIIRREFFGDIGDPRYAAYAGQIEDCGLHLLDVLGKTMDLSRAARGGLKLEESIVDLVEVTQLAEKLSKSELDRFESHLETDLGSDVPRLLADRGQVAQMLVNLICNAARHSNGKPVELHTAVRADGGLDFSVVDQGSGMSAEEIRKAIIPFGRSRSDEARQHPSLGIGLPLTKRLIELHGGELAINSKPGQGTTVTLRFPAYRVRAAGVPAATQPINLQ